MDLNWITTPIAVALIFEVISTVAQIAGFGGLLIWQRTNFERRITALEIQHQAERKADRAQHRRENDELRGTIRVLTNVVRELKPDAEIPLTGAHDIVETESIKRLREFVRKQYSAEEFSILMADFGLNPDEYASETVIARMDKFIRLMARSGRLDDLRDRVIADRPAAAAHSEAL